jgi:hypothetical protein
MKDWLTAPEPKDSLAMQMLKAIGEVCRMIGKVIVFLLFGAWL